MGNSYGDIRQRWLVVESQARLESDSKQLEKRIARQLTLATRALHQARESTVCLSTRCSLCG
ncbi:MAG: hypothetical protein F6K26_53640 [Moorea sp. SIO2I5]|nr:hypothetical protein [Moorena sp. SIO2I5]